MASVCLAEQGGCLLLLGRLDEAAAATKRPSAAPSNSVTTECRRRQSPAWDRRLQQRRYPEALAAYEEARSGSHS